MVPSVTIDLTTAACPGSYGEALVTTDKRRSGSQSVVSTDVAKARRGNRLPEEQGSSIEVYNTGTSLMGRVGDLEYPLRKTPLERRRWYLLTVNVDGGEGVATVSVSAPRSASPGRDLMQHGEEVSTFDVEKLTFKDVVLRLAAGLTGERWDGRIAEPKLRVGEVVNGGS